jgi:hypothetical protein
MLLRDVQMQMQTQVMAGEPASTTFVANVPPLSPAARLAIYRTAYVSRLTGALRTTFVKLHQVLGDDVFDAAAAEFITAHPSTTRSIRWFGSQFSAFLHRRAPYSAQPILAELARFEWTLTEVFDAGDRLSRGRELFLQTPPERWGALSFTFQPAVRTLSLRWNTVAVWQALDQGNDAPAPEKSVAVVHWLLWRHELRNLFRSIDSVEFEALTTAMTGLSFAHVCERLQEVSDEDQIPLRAAGLLAAWADSGILVNASQDGANLT